MTPAPNGILIVPALLTLLLAGCGAGGLNSPANVAPGAPGYRIYDTTREEFLSAEEMTRSLLEVDVVLFGEFHDDTIAHRAQDELLARLMAGWGGGVLGLEMFERDVQGIVDGYVRAELDEERFLAMARPWSNYVRDYRPLVERARLRGWRVLATNLPQRHATRIAREGLEEALSVLDATERGWAASEMECPLDGYWDRFMEAMMEGADSSAHAAALAANPMMVRAYEAQCARDETMAEAIVLAAGVGPVFHVNGAFHSDFGLGIVPRIRRRNADLSIVTISALPVEDLASARVDEHLGRAKYLILTPTVE
jgi:uncharacterized iron-regulated protein